MGDFNINLLTIDGDANSRSFLDTTVSSGLLPTVFFPTRYCSARNTATLIDNIFLSFNPHTSFTSHIITSDVSDHYPVITMVPTRAGRSTKSASNRVFTYRSFSQKNIDYFTETLKSNDWSAVTHASSADMAANALTSRLKQLTERCFPLRTSRIKSVPKTPWMTKGLVQSTEHRNRLYLKACKSTTPEARETYKKYRNTLNGLVRNAKRRYYAERINECKSNLRKVWEVVNEIICQKRKKVAIPKEIINMRGETVASESRADAFNQFFVNQTSLHASGPSPEQTHSRTISGLFLAPCTKEELLVIISKLPNGKTQDTFGLCNYILKKASAGLVAPLTHLVNLSLATGVYPNVFKTAQVLPLYKKGDKSLISNYRPISILPVISKVLERVVYNRVYRFLDVKQLLSPRQYGFRRYHSTLHALVDSVEYILNSQDAGEKVLGIFLDFTKAFDTVCHSILLTKLHSFGIYGVAHEWFSSYLTDRKQCVIVEGSVSPELPVKSGVPQGSVLGPLLFILYINDLTTCLTTNAHPVLFADDSNFFIAAESSESAAKKAQKTLDEISDWCFRNKMQVNATKSCIIVFTSAPSNSSLSHNVALSINGNPIPQTTVTKFLGVFVDSSLSFKHHISQLSSTVSRQTSMLHRASLLLSADMMKMLYNAFVFPYLNYCCSVWGNTFKSHLKSLKRSQNRAVKATYCLPRLYPSTDLYRDTGTIDITEIINVSNLRLAHSAISNRIPQGLSRYFELCSTIHRGRALRCNKYNFMLPRRRLTRSQHSPVYRSISVWNSINESIKSIKSFGTLQKRYLSYTVLDTA